MEVVQSMCGLPIVDIHECLLRPIADAMFLMSFCVYFLSLCPSPFAGDLLVNCCPSSPSLHCIDSFVTVSVFVVVAVRLSLGICLSLVLLGRRIGVFV